MGMSASQARLLFISSRMHDIEMKSQNIANQKIRLASDSEQVSANYVKALNKTNLMVTGYDNNGNVTSNQLSYSSIMRPNGELSNSYTLRNTNGKLILSPDMIEAYKNARHDPKEFLKN